MFRVMMLVCILGVCLIADGLQASVENLIQSGDYKGAITFQRAAIEQAAVGEKGKLLEVLAVLYLKDQNQEAAFETFIESLAQTKSQSICNVGRDNDLLYKQALAVYMEGRDDHPQSSALKLIDEYGGKYNEQKRDDKKYFSPLGYLIAIAYANLNRFAEFFDLFYETYILFPDHFLAYKTKAILHLKLMERKRTLAEKAIQRQAMMKNLNLALGLEPHDTTLYKMMIIFSLPENRKEQVQRSLNKILNDNIIIPRGEIMFYVQESVNSKEYALAQRFLDRSRDWYPNSRIVSAAQEYLNTQKHL